MQEQPTQASVGAHGFEHKKVGQQNGSATDGIRRQPSGHRVWDGKHPLFELLHPCSASYHALTFIQRPVLGPNLLPHSFCHSKPKVHHFKLRRAILGASKCPKESFFLEFYNPHGRGGAMGGAGYGYVHSMGGTRQQGCGQGLVLLCPQTQRCALDRRREGPLSGTRAFRNVHLRGIQKQGSSFPVPNLVRPLPSWR